MIKYEYNNFLSMIKYEYNKFLSIFPYNIEIFLLFMQHATEIALEYLASNHDKMEDNDERPCSLTVDVLLKVSFDIINCFDFPKI